MHKNYQLALIEHTLRSYYGDPNGIIRGRGRIEHGTRKGPGRRRMHQDHKRAGSKLSRRVWRGGL